MFRFVTVVILALVLAIPLSADAAKKKVKEQVDMNKYTCGDLLSEDEDEIGAVLIWVDGYLSGKTGDTTIDMDFLSKLGEAVGQACSQNKKAKLLDVVRKLTKQ